jgi:hypothetical protein
VRFTERQSNYQPHKLIAVVNDIEVEMGIVEPLIRSEHRRSPEEESRFKRIGISLAPAYDFAPSGKLISRWAAIRARVTGGRTERARS